MYSNCTVTLSPHPGGRGQRLSKDTGEEEVVREWETEKSDFLYVTKEMIGLWAAEGR